MSTTEAHTTSSDTSVGKLDMKLEVDIIPVSDVDRSKEFYERLGWRLDADDAPLDGLRIVQLTPPGSGASITFGLGLTTAAPGSAEGGLIVSDIEAAHDKLVARGIEVSDIWHGPPFPVEARQPGPDPERTSYGSFFYRRDTDRFRDRILVRAVERATANREQNDLPPLPEITPHSLRRTWATFAAMIGRDPKWIAAQIGHVSPAFTFSVYQQVATRRYVDEQAIWALMRFADEPAERAPSRQVTRGDGRGAEVEKGDFDRAIERLNDAASDADDSGV